MANKGKTCPYEFLEIRYKVQNEMITNPSTVHEKARSFILKLGA